MHYRRVLLLVPVLIVLGTPLADAHVALSSSTPAAGAEVPAEGFALQLRFSGRVDAQRSRLTLTASDGTTRKLTAKAGKEPSEVTAQVPSVPAGQCQLRYDVLSADGHLMTGTLAFTVAGR